MTTLTVETLKGGKSFVLDQSLFIAEGTEGEVYRLPGDDSLVIKLYKEKVDAERLGKLHAMVANPPDDPMKGKGHASIAWPRDLVVLPGNKEVRGFVMPRLPDPHPISRFYHIEPRQKYLPSFTYQSLCILGANLASAVWALHEKGYVIGDINEGNIMATDKALVTIVDTDSFQIKDQNTGRVYRCPVYTPSYTPPEFQDPAVVARIDRSPEQDLFGIGVVLFQLLMEGQLPFACAFTDPDDGIDAIECLKRGYFPYGQSVNGIIPPPIAPPYAMVHPALQKLFNRCFIDGYKDPGMRPTAKVWHRALVEAGRELIPCKANRQHYYFNHLQQCPWCERKQFLNAGKKRRNIDPFPAPRATASAGRRSAGMGAQTPISTPPPPPPPRPRRPGVTPAAPSSPPPPPPKNVPAPPLPVALQPITVELQAPISLHSAQLALLKTLPLKQPTIPLISPMGLKEYQPLNGITVDLNYA